LEGCYDEDDSAREVVNIRRDETTKSLWFQVSWKPRKDLRVPKPAWISDSMLKDHNPEVLCEFLVKKIKWPSK
jgi:chromobox protein 1/chromobox protein 3